MEALQDFRVVESGLEGDGSAVGERGGAPVPDGDSPADNGRAFALSQSHICTFQGIGRVRNALGGSVVKVQIPSAGLRKGGGKRSQVGGFSRASRQRLLERLHEICQAEIPAGSIGMVTLTWPGEFPAPGAAKVCLVAWIARLRRAWGRVPLFWKLEPQVRGAPHFHLLVFWGQTISEAEDKRRVEWCSRAWYDLAGGGDCKHLAVHLGQLGNRPCHEVVKDWNQVLRYAGKYVGKPVEDYDVEDEWLSGAWRWPGRWWGVRHAEGLPRRIVERDVPLAVAYQVKRVLRRYVEHQSLGRCRIVLPGGRIERRWVGRDERATLESFRQVLGWQPAGQGLEVRPYRRVVRRGREDGKRGIMCFLADPMFRRVVDWAARLVASRVDGGDRGG